MLSKPTTDTILEDLAREVREQILPLIDDPAVRVNLEMMEQLLTAAAVRAAHEIAWMADGDHGFKPRKSSGCTLEDNLAHAIESARSFIRENGSDRC